MTFSDILCVLPEKEDAAQNVLCLRTDDVYLARKAHFSRAFENLCLSCRTIPRKHGKMVLINKHRMDDILPYPRGDLVDFIKNEPEKFVQILQDETADLGGLWQNLNDEIVSTILESTGHIGKAESAVEQILYRSFVAPPEIFHPKDQVDVQLKFVSALLNRGFQIPDFAIKNLCFIPCIIYLGCLDHNSFHVLLGDILEEELWMADDYRRHLLNPGPLLSPAAKTDRWKFCKNLIILRKDFHTSSHQRLSATMEIMEIDLDPAAKASVTLESDRILEITGLDVKKMLS